jgi:hypothetical protein
VSKLPNKSIPPGPKDFQDETSKDFVVQNPSILSKKELMMFDFVSHVMRFTSLHAAKC